MPTDIRAHRSSTLDALRGVAALMVLVWHAYPVGANGSFDPGWTTAFAANGLGQGGVTLFFVLSGLLIGGPFLEARLGLRRDPDLRPYALRRAARIAPAYWLALLGMVAVIGYVRLQPPSGGQVLEHALFAQDDVPAEAFGFFPPGWTLGIEVMFYAGLPLALFALLRGRRATADGLTLGVVGVWLVSSVAGLCAWGWFPEESASPWGTVARYCVLATVFMFCPGLLIAIGRASPPGTSRVGSMLAWLARHRLLSALLIASAFVLGCAARLPGNSAVLELRYQAFMVAAALLVNLALDWRIEWRRALGILPLLGRWSYGIYLWNYTVAFGLSRLQLTPPASYPLAARWLLFGLPVFALTIPMAALSWRYVERPLIVRAQAWRPRERAGHAQPALSLGDS